MPIKLACDHLAQHARGDDSFLLLMNVRSGMWLKILYFSMDSFLASSLWCALPYYILEKVPSMRGRNFFLAKETINPGQTNHDILTMWHNLFNDRDNCDECISLSNTSQECSICDNTGLTTLCVSLHVGNEWTRLFSFILLAMRQC